MRRIGLRHWQGPSTQTVDPSTTVLSDVQVFQLLTGGRVATCEHLEDAAGGRAQLLNFKAGRSTVVTDQCPSQARC